MIQFSSINKKKKNFELIFRQQRRKRSRDRLENHFPFQSWKEGKKEGKGSTQQCSACNDPLGCVRASGEEDGR